METMQLVEKAEMYAGAVVAGLNTLADAVGQASGFAFAQLDLAGEPALHGSEARALIAAQLRVVDYPPGNDQRHPNLFAVCVASAETRALAEEVNSAKHAFAMWCTELRSEHMAGGEIEATQVLRRVLSHAGYPTLLVSRLERPIPTFSQPAQRLTWSRQQGGVTKRKTIQDAIDALEAQQLPGERDPFVAAEQARLTDLGLATPVCHKLRQATVHGVICRLRTIDEDRQASTHRCYGGGLILVGDEPALTPVTKVPDNGIRTRRQDNTRAVSRIAQEAISPLLPQWFTYNQVPDTAKPAAAAKTQNPHAKTYFSGIWIGFRARKSGPTAFFMVAQGSGVPPKTFNIDRLGIAQAWTGAAHCFAEHHDTPVSEVLNHRPEETQIVAARDHWLTTA